MKMILSVEVMYLRIKNKRGFLGQKTVPVLWLVRGSTERKGPYMTELLSPAGNFEKMKMTSKGQMKESGFWRSFFVQKKF